MENLEIWNKYREVPANALKEFNNGKFKGTDINTMWRMKCLTEQFGICGFGWYYKPIKLWTERCDNGDVFAFAEIELFIKIGNEWSQAISGTGGNKLTRITKDGEISTSDEAFKMAITDAIGVACKNLGFGADVYWENDRTKYTENTDSGKTYKRTQENGTQAKFEAQKEKQYTIRDAMYYKLTGGKYDGQTLGYVKDVDIEYLNWVKEKYPDSMTTKMINILIPQEVNL